MTTTKKTTTKKATAKKATAKKATAKKATAKKATAKKATAATQEFSPRVLKAFHNRIKEGAVDKVASELARGLPVDLPFDVDGYGSLSTPLQSALGAKQSAVARLLIEAGASVDKTDRYRRTPLHQPVDVEIATLLLERGADVHARDKGDDMPLHCACQQGDLALVELLLAHGAQVEAEGSEGRTPYESTSDPAIREALKAAGATGLRAANGRPLKPKSVGPAAIGDIDVSRGCLGVDAAGNVWFAGYAGVFRYDGKDVQRFEFEESFALDRFAVGKGERLYFSTNWGLLETDSEGKQWRLHDVTNSGLFDNHIIAMNVDPQGSLYLIGYEDEADAKHISVYDGTDWQLLRPGHELPDEGETTGVAFDAEGRMLLLLEDGYAYVDDKTDRWDTEAEFGDEDGIFAPTVYGIAVEGQSSWFGTSKGIYRLRKGKFKHYEADLTHAICVHGGTVYGGGYMDGVLRLDPASGEQTLIGADALPDTSVQAFATAPDGTVWIRTSSGVARLRDGVVEPFVA